MDAVLLPSPAAHDFDRCAPMALICRLQFRGSFSPGGPRAVHCIRVFLKPRSRAVLIAAIACLAALPRACAAATPENCPRPAPGSVVPEPPELRSRHGVLDADLTFFNFRGPGGQEDYCYQSKNGAEAPTLRVNPGDLLIVHLRNRLTPSIPAAPALHAQMMPEVDSPCAGARMTALSTNLHFHGMTMPPVCHADDVLRTFVQPGDAPFTYRLRIPSDEPPGLYWYHPHVHGFTNPQVLGGASGALIVNGIERVNGKLAGLPERTFIVRDQELLNPNASPADAGAVPPPPVFRDAEGDILNTGTGTGKPAKDLSINFVPVPYPDYPPAVITVMPSQRQLWRVLNASAITYIDLQIVVGDAPQNLGVVSIDGVPIDENGMAHDRILWVNHVFLPPGARVEWIFQGVPPRTNARLITRSVDTGPDGENDPARPLANIVVSPQARPPRAQLAESPVPLARSNRVWLADVRPARSRLLYFSERPSNPQDPQSPTIFMITVEGQPPAPFDPHQTQPNIVVHQGDVEDWVIENRSREMHAFHIHQVHFLLTQWNGEPVDEPFLRDSINVPVWDGRSSRYPSVTLRMDFRDPNAVGTFVYHCHLLEHEDGGMMGIIRVLPHNHSIFTK
jgi:FtsP/CotA-like multicopper oxidase with cupredoxin domain